MGNLNFQDVIRDVHDPNNHALQISGTINAAGQATVTPLQAWPDPHSFIGLVTIAGGTVGSSGNPTLNASPNYIGLTTSVIGNNPVLGAGVNGIGFATVAFSNAVGNATLNPGPNYIGLATVDMGVNKAWTDPKTYIGLVTIDIGASNTVKLGTNTLNIGSVSVLGGTINSTLQTSTLNIGSVSVLGGTINSTLQSSTLNIGSVSVLGGGIGINAGVNNIGFATVANSLSWPDPKTFIGLVTVGNNVGNATLNPSPNFIGLVTVGNQPNVAVVGNVTLSDSKGFVGLVTVKASILDTYASLATFTISIASLATSTTGVGRQSTLIDNSATNYQSAMVYLKIYSGGLAHTPNTLINVYLLRRDNNSVGDDGVGTSDAAATFVNAPILGNILFNASNVSTAYYGVFDTSPLGPLGPQWGIGIVNVTGAALGGTESNHLKNWIGINRRLT